LLPGGLFRDGERRRRFAFRPLDGRLELRLAEASEATSPPAAVTAVLAAALAEVGGEPASEEIVRRLTVGDRQFLVRQLAAHLGRDPIWLTAPCQVCGESFDISVSQAALPVKEAGAGFPFVEITTARGPLTLRVPDGADQEAIASLPEAEGIRALAERCRLDVGADGGAPPPLSAAERAAAEAALEVASPEVALGVLATCPECGAENEVGVDPYLCLLGDGEGLFVEVDLLASRYGWSEAEILALPRARRQRYLRLIDQARGMVQ